MPGALSSYGFSCYFYAKSPRATTTVALTPPSSPLLPWAPDPFTRLLPGPPGQHSTMCLHPRSRRAAHVHKIYVQGRLLMYCVCDSEALATAQRAVSGGMGS